MSRMTESRVIYARAMHFANPYKNSDKVWGIAIVETKEHDDNALGEEPKLSHDIYTIYGRRGSKLRVMVDKSVSRFQSQVMMIANHKTNKKHSEGYVSVDWPDTHFGVGAFMREYEPHLFGKLGTYDSNTQTQSAKKTENDATTDWEAIEL